MFRLFCRLLQRKVFRVAPSAADLLVGTVCRRRQQRLLPSPVRRRRRLLYQVLDCEQRRFGGKFFDFRRQHDARFFTRVLVRDITRLRCNFGTACAAIWTWRRRRVSFFHGHAGCDDGRLALSSSESK
jgi:hypothetical protein